jgi:hypothetical protein
MLTMIPQQRVHVLYEQSAAYHTNPERDEGIQALLRDVPFADLDPDV